MKWGNFMREKILFDKDWRFHEGDIKYNLPRKKGAIYSQAKTVHMRWGPAAYGYDDRSDVYHCDNACTEYWENVDLPHDYIITQEPKQEYNDSLGYFDYHNAWYRKHFWLDEQDRDKRITLYFEGITGHATVYLNGCVLKRNFCGYTSFEADITDIAYFDRENILAVYVDVSEHEGWWYEGAGIYRHVWLIKTALTAVDLWGVYVTPKKDGDRWTVGIETTVLNESTEDSQITVTSSVVDETGQEEAASAASPLTILAKDKAVLKQEVAVDSPALWDIDTPNLYQVHTVVSHNGVEIDRVVTRFGFRTIEFDPDKGFFLNGRHVKIKGVCCHQDYGLTGKAVPDNVHRYRTALMKEMGANAYRTAHYPHAEAVMDALDELGILVMDETRWFSSSDEAKEQLAMLVKRDRNRPSVILWSVANEEPLHESEQGCRITETLKAVVKKYDATRPITAAISNNPLDALATKHLEVIGVNYNLKDYDAIHEKYPNLPFVSTENCATGSTRSWYSDSNPLRGYINAYDHDTDTWFRGREMTWKFIMDRDWVAGGFQWAGIEHRGETVWPRLCSQSGAIDLFLQKKDAFYQNQSFWSDKPMIHLLPHWNHTGMEGELIEVWAYTNCQEAELFLNGKSLGCQKVERYSHAVWNVPYEPGVMIAVGRNDGGEAAKDMVETAGSAKNLHLRMENEVTEANGRDLALFTCYCTDDEGRFVPDAMPFISFDTNSLGVVVGTGSDVSDHVPVPSPDRRMRAGLCSVAVRVGTEPGELKLRAAADGMKCAVISVPLK